MTVVSVDKDPQARTLTVVADFDASKERVWRLWSDPGRLARWWTPPGFPLTISRHELRPGGRVEYEVSTPDGDRFPGWWRIETVDPPHGLTFTMADPTTPDVTVRVELTGNTRMTMIATFATDADMTTMIGLGFAEGLTAAIGQIPDLLRATDSGPTR